MEKYSIPDAISLPESASSFMIEAIRKRIFFLLKHPFAMLGIVTFIGSMSTNVLSYIFNVIMSHALSTSDFGIFSSLNSLTYLFYIPATTLILVSTRFVAEKKAKNKMNALGYLVKHYTKYLFVFGIVLFLLFLACSNYISSYLHIHDKAPLIWLELTFIVVFPMSLLRGTMNGLLRIVGLSVNLIIESVSKIIFAIVLLFLSQGVLSGIIPAVLAMVIAYVAGLFALRDLLFSHKKSSVKKEDKIPWRKLIAYAFPVFLTSFFLNSLYTNDIILAKHFFTARDAGLYAGLALAGKVVFFGSSFLAGVLFPYASFKHAKGEKSRRVFIYTAAITFFLACSITLAFFIAPQFFVKVFLGANYLPVSSMLWLFGIFISLLSVINVFLNFFLSTLRVKVVILPILATLMQAIGIHFYHTSISSIVFVNIATAVVLLLALVLYSVRFYETT